MTWIDYKHGLINLDYIIFIKKQNELNISLLDKDNKFSYLSFATKKEMLDFYQYIKDELWIENK